MSIRTLRKLQERQKLEKIGSSENIPENDENSSASDEASGSFRVCNRFDLLNEGTHSETETKGCDESSEVLSDSTTGKHSMTLNSEAGSLLPTAKTGAKRKKRKRKKKNTENRSSSIWNEDKSDAHEIDKCIMEVNAILGEMDNSVIKDFSLDEDSKPTKSLLKVEYKHLNPQNEMKRIFGARVVQANEFNNKKRNPRRGGAGGSRSGRLSRIVQPLANWKDKIKSGLSMSLENSTGSLNYFRFHHNALYQQAQFRFLRASRSLNPDNILRLLHEEPHHVDTLLQVSEIFRLADDSAMAAQLIERSIFIMECVAHPLFNIAAGNVRINYKQQENRGFFVALFRHILNVGNKGCYRTALELCKLLLSLSPDDDPLAVSLMIDFYAVRAKEYDWLVSLYDLYEPTKHLSMLPNFSFSVPLAIYHLSEMENRSTDVSTGKSSLNSSGTKLWSNKELRRRADDMLQKAIFMFPAVVSLLLDKCGVQADVQIDLHPYFGITAQVKMSKGLSQIVKLYVGRTYHLWKEQNVISWLEENFKVCLERAVANDPLMETCEEKRKLRYQCAPTAIYRHILIAEVKDVTASLPPSLANTAVLSFDPLPPADSVCDYSPPSPPKEDPSPSNLLLSFIRGILPDYDPSAAEAQDFPDLDGAVGDGAGLAVAAARGGDLDEIAEDEDGQTSTGTELRASVGALLDAMRNLFSNINLADTVSGADAAAEESDTSDDAEQDFSDPDGEWE